MYKVNDTVIYGTQGVCKIVDISVKDFMGQKREYYVMEPNSNSSTTLFVPTDSEAVLAKMRKILSGEEIHALIMSLPNNEIRWIENENERRERFREIVASGEHKALIQMIKAIWLHKQAREAEGKRLHMSDERFFKEAEQLLYGEFQYVLRISKEELISYIFNHK